MKLKFSLAIVMSLASLAVWSPSANAQWGYPGGYGGFGWGGWGGGVGTYQGSVARGMGVYAAGMGYYNQQTAVARSINVDTAMRYNQYVYESQLEANKRHHALLAQERLQTIQAGGQIAKRLRDNPEQRDIISGDALNVALDEINDPRVYGKGLKGSNLKIGGETILNIPFTYAIQAITISIHQLTKGEPPQALMTPAFEAERNEVKSLGQEIRKQIEEGKKPYPQTIDKLLAAINKAEVKADSMFERNSPDRVKVDKYLKALHGLIAMLKTPAYENVLAGVERRDDATLGELLNFMNSFNLRFGAASTPAQRTIYQSLYPKLVELRDEAAPALATAAPPKTTGSEPGDFFSGMSYEDLQKKAPAPPAPPAPSNP